MGLPRPLPRFHRFWRAACLSNVTMEEMTDDWVREL
jgi:hypothetical protein